MINLAVEGVTIITATIRADFIKNIFQNYDRQTWMKKELIIIVNRNHIHLHPYKQKAEQYPNVYVYRVDQDKNLGECLNYGTSIASYNYIAKLDDDDYYSPYYIEEAMQLFLNTNAEIVGKRSCYFYFPHLSKLLLRKTSVPFNSRCRKIAGATIMFHKNVFKEVQFSTKLRQGTDVRFVQGCIKKGFRVFTTSPYNFVAFRRENRLSHTWKVRDKDLLLSKRAIVIHTDDFKKYVDKPLKRQIHPDLKKSSLRADTYSD
ncbi:glycosyl transferase family 2 [Paenibacillus sp. FSL H8-0548]|uniref:glycosyltransferase n=1 Tax=Paenibacillus sp. FSL H8-0548 TaxID=1920422 RepID=UPI00096F4920|nr:glycosyltransferase [Paenibacillus sp. FSL H8-0548]OMF31783.1 glycosyl transferase family 2 [Paenibacillus sp. FSL H8-0548]